MRATGRGAVRIEECQQGGGVGEGGGGRAGEGGGGAGRGEGGEGSGRGEGGERGGGQRAVGSGQQ